MLKINPTDILEYNFCPRFIYFIHVLKIPQYEKRRFKVQMGLAEHEKRQKTNIDYLWKKIGAVSRENDVYLESEKYHIRGIIDNVVTLSDKTLAPVDFKFVPYKEYIFRSHKIQILTYCMLIEEIYQAEVKNGYLIYVRGGSQQVIVSYNEHAKNKIIKDIDNILTIIEKEIIPKVTGVVSRCIDCTYKNICVH
jgi:CRISPR-associated exonuclease Cas4